MSKISSIRTHYNNSSDGQDELIKKADTGIYKLTLNFYTEEAFEEFIQRTGLVELYTKRQLHFHRPTRDINEFF